MFFDRLLVFLGLKRPNEESPSPHLSSVRARPVSGTKLRTLDDLSRVLGVDSKALESFDVRYHQFRIAKRSRKGSKVRSAGSIEQGSARWPRPDKMRTIQAPNPQLKALQRKILRRVLGKLKASDAAMAYERGRSIVTHAERHSDQAVVIGMDICDFFGSTGADRVQEYFRAIGWDKRSSSVLTRLVTFENALPQGAPTSPRLANLVNVKMDACLAGLAKWAGGTYSRYSDDIAFSFPHDNPRLVKVVVDLAGNYVTDFGYDLHMKEKLFIRRAHQRQVITGLVVNNGPPRLSRETKRWLRAVRHRMSQGGQIAERPTLSPSQLQGWEAFERMVEERGEA
jgi:hypothetical protein